MSRLPPNSAILADGEAVAREAASRLLAAIVASPQAAPAICLAGGSTPKRLYGLLATEFASALPWDRVHWFWGDERMVAPDSPDSNYRLADEPMLSRMNVPAGNIHPVSTAGLGADAAAAAYREELDRFRSEHRSEGAPLFDVTLLGMGPDGHTASLFPGKPAIEERDLWAVGVPEPGLAPKVPRVTLTRPALASSRLVLFLVGGAEKRDALGRIAAGEDLPAALVARDSAAEWLIDRAAAGEGA